MSKEKDNYTEIILSLHEKYFNKILDGSKTKEYRMSFLKSKSKAYIYLTKNRQEIAGIIYFGLPKFMDTEAILDESMTNGTNYSTMIEWLNGRSGCYSIPIEKVVKFKQPIDKTTLKSIPGFLAPQTYLLLDNREELKDFLHDYENKMK